MCRSLRPFRALLLVLALFGLPGSRLAGQAQTPTTDAADRPGWRLGLGASIYQIDDLAGSPLVPTGWLARTLGRQGVVALTVHGIRNAGFYSADALAAELDLGVRVPLDRLELTLVAGPSGILGGDSDGTPYTGGGIHAAGGATIWLGARVGVSGRGVARRWWGVGNAVLWSGSVGLVLRL